MNAAERILLSTLKNDHAIVPWFKASSVRDRGVKKKFAASLDFAKFFQQFELLVKDFWAVKFDDRVFHLSTIPTGAVLPPLFCQALSHSMLCLAVRRSGTTQLVEHDCCIDNLRMCSDNLHALRAAWQELLSIIEQLGATIGEHTPPPTDTPLCYTYLGMDFFHEHETSMVRMSSKARSKAVTAIATLRSVKSISVIDVLALFGQTVWASTVTNFNLGEIYHVIKFVRRVQRRALTDMVEIWPSIVPQWIGAFEKMLTMTFTIEAAPTSSVTVFTDASEDGWGVVVIGLGDRILRIVGGRWSREEAKQHINILEMRALRIAVRVLSEMKRANETLAARVRIDNTSARAWALRRRAFNFEANQLTIETHEAAKQANITFTEIDYVRSCANMADAPSRMFSRVNCVRNEIGE
jgi:hypothetical protein